MGRGGPSSAIMDDCWWWSSSIPANKRASHMIIIGFLCVTLAAGLSNGGEYGSRREYADTREGRHESPTSSLLRDADSSMSTILSALKHTSHSTDSQGEISSMSRHSNNYISEINKVKVAAATTNSATSISLSLSSTSILSQLNYSAHASAASSPAILRSSPTSYRSHRGERLLHGGHMRRAAAPGHHLRVASQGDATSNRRVRRKASNRGNPFVFEPKSPKQLFCRTGYRLAIHEDGTINGTKNTADIFSSLYIQAQSRSYVSIQGIYSQLYVCVDDNGNLYGAEQMDRRSCLFQERFEPNFFNTYVFNILSSSSRRRRGRKTRYLSINKDGVTRVAKVRSPKKSHFLPITPPKELL